MLDSPQYDPQTPNIISDIVGNSDIWNQLEKQIRDNSCPHILLCGPAGCGKSLFLRLALENSKRPILSIDCTANSGLRDLRDVLRGFSRGSRTNNGDYRWVILEHADSLAADTQAFLRRMMETTSNTTRFAFECRDAGAISEPILSRSTLFVVNSPEQTEIIYELKRRVTFENQNNVPDEKIAEIASLCGGNMRKALMNLLSMKWNPDINIMNLSPLYEQIKKKPDNALDWTKWAIETEMFCRNNGYDIRDVLQLAWPNNSHVFYICSQWSRLGGISPRALFYECISRIQKDAVKA